MPVEQCVCVEYGTYPCIERRACKFPQRSAGIHIPGLNRGQAKSTVEGACEHKRPIDLQWDGIRGEFGSIAVLVGGREREVGVRALLVTLRCAPRPLLQLSRWLTLCCKGRQQHT